MEIKEYQEKHQNYLEGSEEFRLDKNFTPSQTADNDASHSRQLTPKGEASSMSDAPPDIMIV